MITRLRNFGLGFLTLSGVYLYASTSASIPYLGLVLLHIAGGFLFAALLLLGLREFWDVFTDATRQAGLIGLRPFVSRFRKCRSQGCAILTIREGQ